MIKKLLFLSLLLALASFNDAAAQCTTPLTSLNENFQAFQQSSFPQNCWTSSTTQTLVTDWFGDGNLAAFMLTGPGAQNPSYLVSPSVTFNSPRTVAFEAIGTGTLQVGILPSASDFSGFIPLETFRLFGNKMQFHTITPALQVPHYIAFKLIPAATTSHAVIDEISWPSNLNCETAVSSFLEDFTTFTGANASQNCWAASYDESYMQVMGVGSRYVMFACEQSENVNELYIVSPRITDLSGNHTLSFRVSGADGLFQAGTTATGYDFSSFTPSGAPVAISTSSTNHNVTISAPAGHRHVALKFTLAPGMDSALGRLREIALDQPLAVTDFEKADMVLYPNPASGTITLDANSISEIKALDIYNVLGQNVKHISNYQQGTTIDVSALPNGTYLMNIMTDSGSNIAKFIKR